MSKDRTCILHSRALMVTAKRSVRQKAAAISILITRQFKTLIFIIVFCITITQEKLTPLAYTLLMLLALNLMFKFFFNNPFKLKL